MALAFALIGVALIVTAYRNTFGALGHLLAGDAPGFLKWGAAIIAIGLLQYIPSFATASKYLLALVLLVIVLVNKGAFANFQAAVDGSPQSVQGGPTPTLTGNPTVDISGGSTTNSASSAAGSAIKALPVIGGLFGGL